MLKLTPNTTHTHTCRHTSQTHTLLHKMHTLSNIQTHSATSMHRHTVPKTHTSIHRHTQYQTDTHVPVDFESQAYIYTHPTGAMNRVQGCMACKTHTHTASHTCTCWRRCTVSNICTNNDTDALSAKCVHTCLHTPEHTVSAHLDGVSNAGAHTGTHAIKIQCAQTGSVELAMVKHR